MDGPSPWKLDPATGSSCGEGQAGHEWLRFATEVGDIVYHVEWRLTRLEGEPAYNSGCSSKQCRRQDLATRRRHHGRRLPVRATLVNGTVQRSSICGQQMTENRIKRPANGTLTSCAVGREISLWVNGAVTSVFKECDVPRGHVGLEAEGYRVEYRNVLMKPIVEKP